MYQSFTKKLAIAAGLMVLAYPPQLTEAQEVTGGEDSSTYGFVEQNRNAWRIFGCSQRGQAASGDATTDGSFADMFDDNLTTFWHSNYSNDNRTSGHFFIIDRGADFANTTVDGFGYLPRQNAAGNGFINKFHIYVLPESDKEAIEAIPTVGLGQNQQTANGSHEALATFLADKTAVSTDHNVENTTDNLGVFGYDPTTWSADNRLLQQVKFDQPQTGRYVIFVVEEAMGGNNSQGTPNNNANCAEFYLYDWLDTSTAKTIEIELLRYRTDLEDRVLYKGTRDVYVGQTVPAYGFATCEHQGRIDENTTKLTYVINPTEEVYIMSAQDTKAAYNQPNNRIYIGTRKFNEANVLTASSTQKKMLMIDSRINENVVYFCDPEGEFKGFFGGHINNNAQPIPLADAPRNAQPYLLVRNEDHTFAIRNANRRTGTTDYMNHYAQAQPGVGGWQNGNDQTHAGSHWFVVPADKLDQFENNLQYFNSSTWMAGSLFTAINNAEQQLELNPSDELAAAIEAAKAADFGRDDIAAIMRNLRSFMNVEDEARTSFLNYTGTRYADNESFGSLFAVPGWSSASDPKALNLYNAIKAQNNSDMSDAIDAIGATTANTNQKNNADFTEGVLYRIASTDLSARGYLCVTDEGVLTNTTNQDATNLPDINDTNDAANFLFGLVTVDGKNYMYSAKTGTVLNGFAPKNDIANHAQYHDFTWQLTDEESAAAPTALSFVVFQSSVAHSMVLNGGVRGNSNGGISLVNAGGRPLVAPGLANAVDGNGLQFTFGGFSTNYGINLDNIKTQISEAIAAANAAANALPGEDVQAKVVNALTDEAITAVKAAATPDHKEYLMANGTRNEVAAGTVYTLQNATTGKYFAIVNGVQGEADAITDTHTNWLCEAGATDGTFKFAHTVNTAEAARAASTVYLTIGDATEHTITAGDYGQVKIGETPYVMATGSGDAETTGIREISATENGKTVVYDLQGRRVAKTAKGGLYIVNGVKTLVK